MKTPIDRSRITGTAEYYASRATAFALIKSVERHEEICRRVPRYFAGEYDERLGGPRPIENFGPFDAAEAARKQAIENVTVIEILKAQKRLQLLHLEEYEAVARLHGGTGGYVRLGVNVGPAWWTDPRPGMHVRYVEGRVYPCGKWRPVFRNDEGRSYFSVGGLAVCVRIVQLMSGPQLHVRDYEERVTYEVMKEDDAYRSMSLFVSEYQRANESGA